jgi:hypothetical protein
MLDTRYALRRTREEGGRTTDEGRTTSDKSDVDFTDLHGFFSYEDTKAQRNENSLLVCRVHLTRLIVFLINQKDYEHLTKLNIRILENIESELPGVDKSAYGGPLPTTCRGRHSRAGPR